KDPGGFLATVAIGIIGALFGGMLGRMIGMYGQDDPVGFVMAVIGATLFLWLYRVMTRRGDT
ncbi:MAG TPA: GlsB/YeaQ/YmgE family stress response membrane protein, partial [Nitrospirales bacterium]|nr:GlsB/YeaQ/YmgE family stress response membrane protein [Nitrospirales bacterium]